MHTDAWHRGVKKFRQLILVHPHHSILGIQGYLGFAILSMIDDDIAFIVVHFLIFNLQKLFSIPKNTSKSILFPKNRDIATSTLSRFVENFNIPGRIATSHSSNCRVIFIIGRWSGSHPFY